MRRSIKRMVVCLFLVSAIVLAGSHAAAQTAAQPEPAGAVTAPQPPAIPAVPATATTPDNPPAVPAPITPPRSTPRLPPGLMRPSTAPAANAPMQPPPASPDAARTIVPPASASSTSDIASPESDAGGTRTNRLQQLKFNATPLETVLQYYSELTGRTLLAAPGVSATVTLRAQTRLTVAETIQAIKTVLAMNNIGLVDVGDKFVKVVPIASVQQEGLPIQTTSPDGQHPENENVISEIVSLKYIDPGEAQKAVTGLLHGYGKILVLERINSLLIADSTINLNRIKEILAQVDQPLDIKEKMHIRQIRSAKASELKAKLEEIISEEKDKDGKATIRRQRESGAPGADTTPVIPTIPGIIRAKAVVPVPTGGGVQPAAEVPPEEGKMIRGNVRLIADDRTGILIIITRPENMVFFDNIITALDVPTAPDVAVRVVRLEYADAEDVASMLNALIGAASAPRSKDTTAKPATTTGGTTGKPGETTPEAPKSSPLQEFLERQRQAATTPGVPGKTKIGELASENIKILPDKRTNALIMMASKNDMATLMDILKGMDIMLSQVLIEAVILQVSLGDTLERGVDWVQRSMIAYQKKGGTKDPIFAFSGGGGGGSLTPKDATSLAATYAAGAGLTYYFTHFGLNLDAVVKWSSTDSRTKVLSSPVILTTDNKEAKIDVSQELYFYKGISYQSVGGTSNYQPIPNVESRKVGLSLTVKPKINQKKFVVMEISQKIENQAGTQPIEGQGNWPIVATREMTASVAVQSGETIILGGLVENNNTDARTKIPILGDIPILGIPFRSSSNDRQRKEIIVFITPYVLDTPDEIQAESARRKQATEVGPMWEKGWSNSELAEPRRGRIGQWWRNLLK